MHPMGPVLLEIRMAVALVPRLRVAVVSAALVQGPVQPTLPSHGLQLGSAVRVARGFCFIRPF